MKGMWGELRENESKTREMTMKVEEERIQWKVGERNSDLPEKIM